MCIGVNSKSSAYMGILVSLILTVWLQNWTNEILEKVKFVGIAGESCDIVPTFIGIHIPVLVRS